MFLASQIQEINRYMTPAILVSHQLYSHIIISGATIMTAIVLIISWTCFDQKKIFNLNTSVNNQMYHLNIHLAASVVGASDCSHGALRSLNTAECMIILAKP